jgi:LPS export ABC transporter protein LptC
MQQTHSLNKLKMHIPILSILSCVILTLSACSSKPEPIALDPLFYTDDVEIIHDVVMLYSDSLKLRARVEGPKLVKYTGRPEEEREEFTEGVQVTFYDRDGRITSILEADFGVRRARQKEIRGIGNVVLTNETGDVLETEELIWEEDNERVYTHKFVMITTPEEKIWGMGLESNQDFTIRRIKTPQGRVAIDEPAD